MGKTLVIAEKPSVALDISKALGGFIKHDNYFENDQWIISSAVGHLLEIICPEEFEVKRGKWSFKHLPVLPDYFDLNPIKKTEPRLKALLSLLKRKDVDHVINACDAGREGELIFRLIMQYAKSKKPVSRLWLQSMTAQSIKDGFKQLKDDASMQYLADAARSRSEADWLVGINGTRAMSAFNSQEGGFFLTTVGRVQTPTLCLMVNREESILQFIPKTYWEIVANFTQTLKQEHIEFSGRWIDTQFDKKHQKNKDVKDTKDESSDAREWRLFDEALVKKILQDCKSCTEQAISKDESKPSQQNPSLLYDLTSLQREANQRFGFSAKTTLSLAQSLYEKHKAITYPRTDSKHLPQDYLQTCQNTLKQLANVPHYKQFIETAIKGVQANNKRIFDNQKVSDHFAIIPTAETPKGLSEVEEKLYDMITRRFIAAFYPAAQYLITIRLTTFAGHTFKSEGKILTNAGWLAVYHKQVDGEDDLPALLGPKGECADIQAPCQQTKPPARYTEATLLSAMETAGKHVEDEELRDVMQGKGLGTPATRSSIIEGLIAEKYMLREQRELMPTTKAFQLIRLLRGLNIDLLSKPELTGEWEYKLKQIEQGKLTREQFMQGIKALTGQIVDAAKQHTEVSIPGDYATLKTPCPDCGGIIQENYRRFACQSCDFSINKLPSSRNLDVQEAELLLEKGEIGPLQGFRSKQGFLFAANLKLIKENNQSKMQFDFGQESLEPVNIDEHEVIGTCPKCQSRIIDYKTRYICEKAVSHPKTCDFFSAKIVLQQSVSQQEFIALLEQGKTSILGGFKSNKTGRFFKACLVLKEGKIGFEFEAKPEKAAKTEKTTKTKTVKSEQTEKSEQSEKTKKNEAIKKTKEVKLSKVSKATKLVKPKVSSIEDTLDEAPKKRGRPKKDA